MSARDTALIGFLRAIRAAADGALAILEDRPRRRTRRKWLGVRRLRVFERDDWRCRYCGARVALSDHIDHVIPLSRGGSDDIDNLAAACVTCNISKGARTPEEWLQ